MLHLVDPLVDREQRTQGEQDHGHDEGPEVALACVPERVLLGRGASGTTSAQQQQRLVARVGHRVDRLGQQRGRPRDREAHELRDRYPAIGEHGGQDRFRAPVRRQVGVSSVFGPFGHGARWVRHDRT